MIRPSTVSITVPGGAPTTEHKKFLDMVAPAPRVRLVLDDRGLAHVADWVAVLAAKRISADLRADWHTLSEVNRIDLDGVRQVRLVVEATTDPGAVRDWVAELVRRAPERPVVVLLPMSVLRGPPGAWRAVLGSPRVFANITRDGTRDGSGADLPAGLKRWEQALGDRLFSGVPPVAAAAGSRTRGRCPVLLGHHVWLDARRDGVGLCDCAGTAPARLDEDWTAVLTRELAAAVSRKRAACGNCPLWTDCGGGCLPSRGHDDARDVHCPMAATGGNA